MCILEPKAGHFRWQYEIGYWTQTKAISAKTAGFSEVFYV